MDTKHSGHLVSGEDAGAEDWDVIVIGAGMGGAATAYGLVEKGHKVLVLEKGLANPSTTESVTGEEADPGRRLESGRWPTRIKAVLDGKETEIWAPLGSGAGGSTLLYAAALHRLRPDDFESQPHPETGTVSWPFSYDDLRPFYADAETRLSVQGTPDPLHPDDGSGLLPPVAPCDRDAFFMQAFEGTGLHPYRLHCGITYKPGCDECLGRICLKSCKRNAQNSFLEPAIATGRVKLCVEAEVLRVDADQTRVTSIEFRQGDKTHRVTGRAVVLAAGAFQSPMLLLRSASDIWPNGLANGSDQVGRNLMFHSGIKMAFWAPKKLSTKGPSKTIAMRDFYVLDGEKYGEFQSTGLTGGYGNILYTLRQLYDRSWLRRVPVLRQFLRIPAFAAARLFGEATIFSIILEDFSYPKNRVLADASAPSGFRFEYTIPDELRRRIHKLPKLVRQRTRGLRCFPITLEPTLNFGHPCGTCRAGSEPSENVVDDRCRAHELDNLYITDSAFMPTSGGTNPSLTIAANALRVAGFVDADLKHLK